MTVTPDLALKSLHSGTRAAMESSVPYVIRGLKPLSFAFPRDLGITYVLALAMAQTLGVCTFITEEYTVGMNFLENSTCLLARNFCLFLVLVFITLIFFQLVEKGKKRRRDMAGEGGVPQLT